MGKNSASKDYRVKYMSIMYLPECKFRIFAQLSEKWWGHHIVTHVLLIVFLKTDDCEEGSSYIQDLLV